ncbi:hypothetical protein GQ53DRAFT_781958 [Thozetella sp. PMI_491]|nr:hypothetical protein GQ53DRAFT_781958 [Thozetella sp. PMI_491]
MAAAVAVPISTISQNAGVLPPSALSYKAPRHGRSRGASISKPKSGPRPRGYSLADEREAAVAQALAFLLNRSRNSQHESEDESDRDDDNLDIDAEGWADLDDVLAHSKIAGLGVTLAEVQRVVASTAAKGRLALRLSSPDADPADAASYNIRRAPKTAAAHQQTSQAPASQLTDVTADSADLPEFVVFETSYPKYHLILTSGSIKRAGGQPYLPFVPADTTSNCDVSIWVHLQTALTASPTISWKQTESGTFVTSDEVPTTLWKKAVARRGDLGVLFEDGVVRKEVPVGLRGKGAKAKKGKGVLKSREDDGSGSASDE